MYGKWQSAAKFLPHVRGAVSSLEAIKRDGVDSWLTAQKKRWSCPNCGTPFSWYAAECNKCGLRLATEAYEMTGWRKLLCRFVLPMVYRKGKAIRQMNAGQ
jgi:ribosomal protein L37AE/L43A